ncbi:peptidase domain-containing ABC transporter [Azospirillum agricola]|uniref:peptidase domain-containing ABC transporter n=1 Tax=Azospirillum agricola TaxID=1720247 RepID=UPI000A0F149A|nr:ATP-binding cassette domain-containing protein [Azospirillum agricola]SMH63042.1 ATP-binding cassette, subfamily B [Azospirillum lipoferum]
MQPASLPSPRNAPSAKAGADRDQAAEKAARRLLSGMLGPRRDRVMLVLASFALNLSGLALPVTLLHVYDRILPNESYGTMLLLGIGCGVAAVMEAILRVARSALTTWMGARIEHQSSASLIDRLMRMPLNAFSHQGIGTHFEVYRAIKMVREFYSGQALQSAIDIPFAILYLGLIALLAGWLVAIPLVVLGLFLILGAVLGKRMRRALESRHTLEERRLNFISEVLGGVHTVKGLGAEAGLLRRHERLQQGCSEEDFNVARLSGTASVIATTLAQATMMLVVIVGSVSVIDGAMTTGVLTACSMLAGRCVQPVQALFDRWVRYQSVSLALRRIGHVLLEVGSDGGALDDEPAKTTGKADADTVVQPLAPGSIEMDKVRFAYERGPEILGDLSLSVGPGEFLGVVATNASGKTTLLRLILGALRPTDGSVRVGVRGAGSDTASDAMTGIGGVVYVGENPELFKGTILQNLTLFDPGRADLAMEVCRRFGLDRRIASLPQGYETIVGDASQESLPRGARQMICLARALVREPAVLLLDEPNSSLDVESDTVFRRALNELRGSVTILLVTSRPSLLSLADRVVQIVGGRVISRPEPGSDGAASQPVLVSSTPAADSAATAKADPIKAAHDDEDVLRRRLSEASAVGACMIPLLDGLGWRGAPQALAEALPHFSEVQTVEELCDVLQRLHFEGRSLRIDLSRLDPALLPCLFQGRDGAVHTLLSLDDDGNDVKAFSGKTRDTVTLTTGKGTAYVFTPLETTAAGAGAQNWVSMVAQGFLPLLWAVLGLSAVINLLSIAAPLFTMAIYDKVVTTGSIDTLTTIAVGAVLVIGGDFALRQIRGRALAHAGSRIARSISNATIERILMLPVGMSERANIGTQIARVKDLESIRDFISQGQVAALFDVPFALFYLIVMAVLGGPLALVPLAAVLITAGIGAAVHPLVRARTSSTARADTERQEFFVEMIAKMPALRAIGGLAHWRDRYDRLSAKTARSGHSAANLSATHVSLAGLVVPVAGLSTVGVGAIQVFNGAMTPGALMASMMLLWRVMVPLQTAVTLLPRIEQLRGNARQINGLMSIRPEREPRCATLPPRRLKGEVSFSRVSLRYRNDADPALVGVSFSVKPGQIVAIVGPDGAGKSSLLKVMLGLYPPQAGNVRIDGVDIRQMDPIDLRKSVGYVPQATTLFYGTVAQNLRFADQTADDAELRWALSLAGALDEVEALSNGLETRIGDNQSIRLSPSLSQKICLARAYIRRPKILLLDEPASRLDFEGDKALHAALSALRGHSTIFLVTHRPSHLTLADTVLTMDAGMIAPASPAGGLPGPRPGGPGGNATANGIVGALLGGAALNRPVGLASTSTPQTRPH